MKKNKKMMMGIIPIVATILMLVFSSTTNSSSQEVTLDKVLEQPDQYKEKLLMLQGDLIEESVQWDADKTLLRFNIKQGDRMVKVQYQGVKPDTFTDGTIVMVDGIYHAEDQVVYAERLRTRCPSKYESMDKKANKEAYERQHKQKE